MGQKLICCWEIFILLSRCYNSNLTPRFLLVYDMRFKNLFKQLERGGYNIQQLMHICFCSYVSHVNIAGMSYFSKWIQCFFLSYLKGSAQQAEKKVT